MKPPKTALRELSAKYRAVLIKCALMNSGRADAVCGESLYNMLMPYCKFAYITEVDAVKEADRAINNISKNPSWRLVYQSEVKNDGKVNFVFKTYQNTMIRKM